MSTAAKIGGGVATAPVAIAAIVFFVVRRRRERQDQDIDKDFEVTSRRDHDTVIPSLKSSRGDPATMDEFSKATISEQHIHSEQKMKLPKGPQMIPTPLIQDQQPCKALSLLGLLLPHTPLQSSQFARQRSKINHLLTIPFNPSTSSSLSTSVKLLPASATHSTILIALRFHQHPF